ncbi:MAG TPA: ATP-dependent Clp protease adaptor ClpS [Bacteroidales bacterium]|jgi:ATP-dependent Clp protease adaptor protein ClpS|nr:ATP-dependent Clp protease adaptor ClpS [Bacteroidales bacterium]|tara:strand:+ start:323 stop:598 length:276 start_codon:yes stop_codon:yes gene_type:complete
MGTKEKTSATPELDESLESIKNLILFNDDFNSFDFIIQSLVEVCKHDLMQAENCAFIAHYNGKCQVKKGTINILRPIYVEMVNRQITVEIV